MKEIPAENLNQPADELRKQGRRTFVYCLIMLIGGVGVQALPNMQGPYVGWLRLLVAAFLLQLAAFAVGLAIKFIRSLFKRGEERIFSKAFWLDAVEEGFAVWCWLVVAILFRYFQWLYTIGG